MAKRGDYEKDDVLKMGWVNRAVGQPVFSQKYFPSPQIEFVFSDRSRNADSRTLRYLRLVKSE